MPSRVQRRAGTKALGCNYCPKGPNGKLVINFRGKGRAALEKHIARVHANRR